MQLSGIYLPLITPFTDTGAVDLDAVSRLATKALEDGAAGIVALGTTGEHATLSADERAAIVQRCRAVGGTLIVGVAGNDTARVVEEVASLQDADVVMVTTPHYTRPSTAGLIEHFRQVAAASPAPTIVYNVPQRTGVRLSSATLLELASAQIIGVKHAVGAFDEDTVRLILNAPAGFSVLTGDDVLLLAALAIGAPGAILASAHVRTADYVALGNGERAHAADLVELSAALFAEPNPSVIKGVLAAQGRIASAAVRLPLLPASSASVQAALRVASRR